ncbi:MAG: 4a-hydroxytetrahydrobiopterin dehydratase [Armatimonadota bacterium]
MSLDEEKIVHSKTGEQLVPPEEARELHAQLPQWTLAEKSLERDYTFNDFHEAIAFVNRVADVAESENHHPDIFISYNKVKLTLSTHKAGGLTRHDFILAAKINRVTSG